MFLALDAAPFFGQRLGISENRGGLVVRHREASDGTMKTLITSRSTRESHNSQYT
jgi:hypothetical protein